jgi:4-hydroxysphinganine ceramide fatty acyl 2-hydroxylase
VHSEAAYEILDEYHIGFLPETHSPISIGGARPPTPPRTPNNATPTGMSSEEELSITTDIANDYKTHKFLDLSRPLFLQVFYGGFSKEFYLEQVHKPRHYKGGESAPFFGNFLEPLSKTPWWVVPTVWLPCISYGVYEANKGLPMLVVTALYFGLGLAIWTLVEYVMHRCLFHLDEYGFLSQRWCRK